MSCVDLGMYEVGAGWRRFRMNRLSVETKRRRRRRNEELLQEWAGSDSSDCTSSCFVYTDVIASKIFSHSVLNGARLHVQSLPGQWRSLCDVTSWHNRVSIERSSEAPSMPFFCVTFFVIFCIWRRPNYKWTRTELWNKQNQSQTNKLVLYRSHWKGHFGLGLTLGQPLSPCRGIQILLICSVFVCVAWEKPSRVHTHTHHAKQIQRRLWTETAGTMA